METKQSIHGGGGGGGVSLPDDIIFDVLARLPAKPLCRFRCVSKAWCALISDPAFVAAHRSREDPYLLGVRADCSPPEVRVRDMDGNVVRVLNVSEVPQDATMRLELSRLNRVVRLRDSFGADAMILDIGPYTMIIDPAAGRARAFDKKVPTPMWSYGRAVPSGAFKVLCRQEPAVHHGGGRGVQVLCFCMVGTISDSGGGAAEPVTLSPWRLRSDPPFALSRSTRGKATSNGVIYFLPRWHSCKDALDFSIAAFDLESEEWRVINGPSELGTFVDIGLTELKGTLGVVQFVQEDDDRGYYYAIIWLSTDLNKSLWVKEYTIRIPVMWELHKLLGVLDDGRIVLHVKEWELETNLKKTSYHRQGILVFYNPSTKAFTKVMDIFEDILVMYNGSLLS